MKPYTLDDLREAQAMKNHILAGKIAVFLLMSRPDPDTHLKVGMAYALSLEEMGDWEGALMNYMALEGLQITPKMMACVAIHRVRVMRKMGRFFDADALLDRVASEMVDAIPDFVDRDWVWRQIRQARSNVPAQV